MRRKFLLAAIGIMAALLYGAGISGDHDVSSGAALAAESTADAKPVSYSRDIKPILAAKCYACHGPDEGKRKAKLNFDDRATAVKKANASATPEALLAYFLDALVTAPMDPSVTTELSNYLHANGAWTGSDAQLQSKSPGVVHLIAGAPEYQFV